MSIMFFSILMSWKTGDVSKKLAKVFQGVSFFNTPKENWTGGKFNLVMFLDMGLLSLNSIFSAPHGQK